MNLLTLLWTVQRLARVRPSPGWKDRWYGVSPQSPSLCSFHLTTGDVSIGIKCAPGVVGPTEADIDFDIIRNDNDTFTVKYTPRGAGSYTIMVLFADQVGATARGP
jgi:hypothetical protein